MDEARYDSKINEGGISRQNKRFTVSQNVNKSVSLENYL